MLNNAVWFEGGYKRLVLYSSLDKLQTTSSPSLKSVAKIIGRLPQHDNREICFVLCFAF